MFYSTELQKKILHQSIILVKKFCTNSTIFPSFFLSSPFACARPGKVIQVFPTRRCSAVIHCRLPAYGPLTGPDTDVKAHDWEASYVQYNILALFEVSLDLFEVSVSSIWEVIERVLCNGSTSLPLHRYHFRKKIRPSCGPDRINSNRTRLDSAFSQMVVLLQWMIMFVVKDHDSSFSSNYP